MSDERTSLFASRLRSEDLDGCKLILIAPLVYTSPALGVVTIPNGFVCDAYSAPRDLIGSWIVRGIDRRPAVLHDYLYRRDSGVTRAQADRALLEAMESVGIEPWRRNTIYAAVYVFGGRYFQKGSPA